MHIGRPDGASQMAGRDARVTHPPGQHRLVFAPCLQTPRVETSVARMAAREVADLCGRQQMQVRPSLHPRFLVDLQNAQVELMSLQSRMKKCIFGNGDS